jgi:hypothetical protein
MKSEATVIGNRWATTEWSASLIGTSAMTYACARRMIACSLWFAGSISAPNLFFISIARAARSSVDSPQVSKSFNSSMWLMVI